MTLGIIQPAVPAPGRKIIIDADLRFRFLAFFRDVLVGGIIPCATINASLEKDHCPIGTPTRGGAAERCFGKAARFTAGEIEDINLARVIALAPGAEGDLAAV